MSSDKQIAANRLNAQQSTGPRSLVGKTKVSRNALTHGLTARAVVLPDENPVDFESFCARLLASLDPQGALEDLVAENIVTDAWRLRRAPRFEALLYKHGCAELLVNQAKETKRKNKFSNTDGGCLGGDKEAYENAERKFKHSQSQLDDPAFNVARVLKTFPEPFRNLNRHEAALSRSLLKNMHELERLQAKRAGQHVPVPEVVDVDVSVSEPSRADIG
jgi:hypothetical protein